MSGSPRRGVLQICVQTQLQASHSSLSAHRYMNDLIDRIAGTLYTLKLPATWALSDDSFDQVAEPLAGIPDQEFALLADSTWCTPESNRQQLIGELDRRLDLIRNRNFDVSTLVLCNTDLGSHIEAMPSVGIHVVRQSLGERISQRRIALMNYRSGVLHVAPSAVVPGRPGLLVRWDCAYSAKRRLWNAISQRTAQHISIDVGSFVALPRSRTRQLERWLRTVARLREAGRLEIERLSAAAVRCGPMDRPAAQRSILRSAA